jgi:hypothetical protein
MYLGIFIIKFSYTHTHTHTVGLDKEIGKFIANKKYAVFRNAMYT